jgi:quercetin dioxygenase-like cupin family protein
MRTEFVNELQSDGYTDVVTKSRPPHDATEPHAHGFDVRALVLAGDITLTVAGVATHYGTGDIFSMPRGCEHGETVGPNGVTTLAGRR